MNLAELSPWKLVAFWLNIYQCMYVHMFFKMISEGKQADENCGMFGRFSNFLQARKEKPFYYKIANEDYTLDDIKHGMMRGNRAKPGNYMRTLSSNDPKTKNMPQVSQLQTIYAN